MGKGDEDAMSALASLYYLGSLGGLAKDVPRAMKLWEEAADLGSIQDKRTTATSSDACTTLAVESDGMKQGAFVTGNRQAAMKGHVLCRHKLGAIEYYVEGDCDLALQHYMISAKMACDDSLNEIKKLFMIGHATKAQ